MVEGRMTARNDAVKIGQYIVWWNLRFALRETCSIVDFWLGGWLHMPQYRRIAVCTISDYLITLRVKPPGNGPGLNKGSMRRESD